MGRRREPWLHLLCDGLRPAPHIPVVRVGVDVQRDLGVVLLEPLRDLVDDAPERRVYGLARAELEHVDQRRQAVGDLALHPEAEGDVTLAVGGAGLERVDLVGHQADQRLGLGARRVVELLEVPRVKPVLRREQRRSTHPAAVALDVAPGAVVEQEGACQLSAIGQEVGQPSSARTCCEGFATAGELENAAHTHGVLEIVRQGRRRIREVSRELVLPLHRGRGVAGRAESARAEAVGERGARDARELLDLV